MMVLGRDSEQSIVVSVTPDAEGRSSNLATFGTGPRMICTIHHTLEHFEVASI